MHQTIVAEPTIASVEARCHSVLGDTTVMSGREVRPFIGLAHAKQPHDPKEDYGEKEDDGSNAFSGSHGRGERWGGSS
jgi:hypothetical protein